MPDAIRRFLITGKVQGVFFRHSTRIEASKLGIRGFARNLPDGSVEVVAQGAGPAVDALRSWLDRGPSDAHVESVREIDADAATPIGDEFGVL